MEETKQTETATMLDGIVKFIRRYLAMADGQLVAVALWVAHAHALPASDVTPYIQITAATKRTGKTRLLEVLDLLVPRPWLTGRVTAAVLPRRIDAQCPTLLLDESDAAFKHASDYNETLRGILDSGYKRSGSYSVCAAGSWVELSTFCPKAIAGIGGLPATVTDRSIVIKLKRRKADEKVEPFSASLVQPTSRPLLEQLTTWALEAVEPLRLAQPAVPGGLNDRATEVWAPLIAIADLAGGRWPVSARKAALRLSMRVDDDEDDVAVALLMDIAEVFELLPNNEDIVTTRTLLRKLTAQEELRWATYSNGRPMTAHALAGILKGFDIFPSDHWVNGKAVRAYRRSAFTDAFERYGVVEVREPEEPNENGTLTQLVDSPKADPRNP